MMKAKYGVCTECSESGEYKEVRLARVKPPECIYHYKRNKALEYQKRAKERELVKPKAKPKRIAPMSVKKLQEYAKYTPIRDRYLQENKVCEVDGCNNNSNNLHHKAGRNGELLYDVRYFMACCGDCHPRRIHFEPDYAGWARDMGYILTINLKK